MKSIKVLMAAVMLALTASIHAGNQALNDDNDESLNILSKSESESIDLYSFINTYCYLWVDVKTGASALNMKGAASLVTVAGIQETCNFYAGYNVVVSSANGGYLKNGTSLIPYTIRYDGFTSYSLSVPKTFSRNNPSYDDSFNNSRDFKVLVNTSNSAVKGVYSDTITLTISAKN